jgi:hypothetical protein
MVQLRGMTTWAEHLFHFYRKLNPPTEVPAGIDWLYPQQSAEVLEVVQCFLSKYYKDANERTLLLGINPGRFGAGVTGVNFTAARQLSEICGVKHPFKAGSELSAEFIYGMIAAYGGAEEFYGRFFIGSVCPLGFVKDRKNINYYDDKALLKVVEPFIIKSMNELLAFHFNRDRCFCIGEGKNHQYLTKLNAEHGWFEKIIPLPHPRFIMQYRRKAVPDFVNRYLQLLGE